ncbi:G-protein coupled receptors family 1 profile domain-containing protein [Caenorhabditis elegans]|nr:G-protein coupled receptors family 1 profile domain-containing protein [Caenorhabditis elegans]CBO22274.2 G-protein coupled receptors family 1 profile domain-containing protein [Caenorhabditis elegans]|eukprot:NP_001256584.2 human GoNadotropin-Releasing hormone Receptor (GnRHR) related [Caenorhabditis elegans]
MVCIALYRLSALRYPLWVNAVGHSRVPRMLILAWALAVVTMLPQMLVWNEVQFSNITQCVTVWTEIINKREKLSESELRNMKLYSIQNATIIFYIPLMILVACYVLILKDIYKTLNTDTECSSAAYLSEMSSSKTGGKAALHKKDQESFVTLTTRTVRGQEKFRRAKVRSLRITLLLILTYAVTWLPYNLLSWWMVLHWDSYRENLDSNYILNSLVVLNSVINPFIYGRCQGIRFLFKCRERLAAPKTKKICKLLQN